MAYISDFERHEDGRLYGKETIIDEFGERGDVIVPVTKKALKEGLSSVFYIKQFEEYVGCTQRISRNKNFRFAEQL